MNSKNSVADVYVWITQRADYLRRKEAAARYGVQTEERATAHVAPTRERRTRPHHNTNREVSQ